MTGGNEASAELATSPAAAKGFAAAAGTALVHGQTPRISFKRPSSSDDNQ